MEYKEFGFDLFAIMMEKRKKHQLSKSEARCEAVREINKCLSTRSKYFSYLSGLTVKELREIARENGLRRYAAFRKASLIRFLDRQSRVIKKCVEKRMFPDAMKAWVELFAPNKFAAEHYTKVIMNTLSDMSYFGKKKSVVSRKNETRSQGTKRSDRGSLRR